MPSDWSLVTSTGHLPPVHTWSLGGKQCTRNTKYELDVLQTKFVGEVDLPEGEVPLLKESKRHLVLFPIQYQGQGLADLPKSRSFLLDC
ncbi:hypothetical protein JVU11DRAFT_9299 [Chiua virens]|nr:hypothetical protein JVU11DRAFT_9299 [Chiua virens]